MLIIYKVIIIKLKYLIIVRNKKNDPNGFEIRKLAF